MESEFDQLWPAHSLRTATRADSTDPKDSAQVSDRSGGALPNPASDRPAPFHARPSPIPASEAFAPAGPAPTIGPVNEWSDPPSSASQAQLMESQAPVTAASGRTVTTHSGGGFTIIPQFDSSVTDLNGDGNPNDQAIYNGYTSAVETAIKYYESIITNPVTITIDFGYGEVGGNQGNPGSPMTDGGGESTFSIYGYNYGDVRDAVIGNANTTQSPVQLAAAAALPTTDPDRTTVD